jgi:hypothetical protein
MCDSRKLAESLRAALAAKGGGTMTDDPKPVAYPPLPATEFYGYVRADDISTATVSGYSAAQMLAYAGECVASATADCSAAWRVELNAAVAQAVAAARKKALHDAAQAAQPDDSFVDEWFNAKADAVKRIRALDTPDAGTERGEGV